MRARRAFSLVELLVAIGLITAFLGWIAWSTRGDQRDASVRAAAEELAAVLRDTRQRALRDQVCYGVAFNIQNAPGSNGHVLNNRSGGHWYRIIGPAKRTRYPYQYDVENLPQGLGLVMNDGGLHTGNFPDFVDDVAHSWRSEPYVLPARKVRFLAIGDLDQGPRQTQPWDHQVWYGSNGQTTYPRPWFGYFDPVAKRLYPWGGYDPAIPMSGFSYQGNDGPITDSCNPSDLTVDHDWDGVNVPDPNNGKVQIADVDRNGDGKFDAPYEKEVAWPIWKRGEGRPVVNADWLDACLVFMPNGEAEFQEWNRARRAYDATQPGSVGNWAYYGGHEGIPFRAKGTGNTWAKTLTSPWPFVALDEVCHYVKHTGAYRITLGPDSLDDRDIFANEAEAVETITPAWTVSITTLGVVSVSRVQTRKGYLKSLPQDKLMPQNPTDWLDSTDGSDANPVAKNFHAGWLHQDAPYWYGIDQLQPIGQPILEVLDPEMLSRRIWWRE